MILVASQETAVHVDVKIIKCCCGGIVRMTCLDNFSVCYGTDMTNCLAVDWSLIYPFILYV